MVTKEILWVDDDLFFLDALRLLFLDVDVSLHRVHDLDEALTTLGAEDAQFDAVVVDIRLPSSDELARETKAGHESGWYLARWIKKHRPEQKVMACSSVKTEEIRDWFRTYADGFLPRDMEPYDLVHSVTRILGGSDDTGRSVFPIRTFIVHGHDIAELYQLKDFLQFSLSLPEPIILREQPSCGRTLIENLEHIATHTDVVFVLLTPDDQVGGHTENEKRRARQNVIFELGYFYGRLRRTSGRILVLLKGEVELPSDIKGLVYIDITNGIQAAGEAIRRQLKGLI